MSKSTFIAHTNLVAQARWLSPLGPITLAATECGLTGAWFDGQAHHPGQLLAPHDRQHPCIVAACEQLEAYFGKGLTRFSLPLDLRGTPFQGRVWKVLQTIEHGTTRSYSEIARAIGAPEAMRAVGAAVARNPVSIIVPCHRVLGSDGKLTGYAGGLGRKQALLEHEAATMTSSQQSERKSHRPASRALVESAS
ncbi:MAG TPA: methylated-DNA--[protein]-cysteine S-methyltransferase [Burkholderiaceae bacterium]|nr:methylated-DNA--[protein]-cysteine S-methyltransferase [Burkholderiaceae bacterium]